MIKIIMQTSRANAFINAEGSFASFDPYKHNYEIPAMADFKMLRKFRDSGKFDVGQVTPIAVSPFGLLGRAKAGFAYMHADVSYRNVRDTGSGRPVAVPGLAFVRGNSVAMLTFLRCEGVDYMVLTEQARLPIGEVAYVEIPAGMADAASGRSGYAAAIAKEMEEEVGLILDRNTEFKELGTMIPSAGGCDERIKLYFTRVHCSKAVLAHLEGKLGGALLENEMITARVRPVSLVRKQILSGDLTDAKLISALWFYENNSAVRKWSCARHLAMGPNDRPQLVMPPLGCFDVLVAGFQRWRSGAPAPAASATLGPASRSWIQGWSWCKPAVKPATVVEPVGSIDYTRGSLSVRTPAVVVKGTGLTVPGQIV
jgi:ADP-sugar diphosphatase